MMPIIVYEEVNGISFSSICFPFRVLSDGSDCAFNFLFLTTANSTRILISDFVDSQLHSYCLVSTLERILTNTVTSPVTLAGSHYINRLLLSLS
jgi:AAA15 family ATPase/GTPase